MAYTLDPLRDSRWSEFVGIHPAASIFHTTGWLDALRRTYGYEPIVYTTSPPGAELTNGIPFCRINSWLTGRRLVSLPFTDHCEPLVSGGLDREALAADLRAAIKLDRLRYVEVRPKSSAWQAAEFGEESRYSMHMLDLRPTLEDLFRALHKDAIQRKIRRAEREGITCEEGIGEAHLSAFYELMLETRRRHGLPPQPIHWFRNLIACLGERVRIRIALRAGRPIASILTLEHGNTVVYKYGCSDARMHRLGAMPLLFWTAIQQAKRAGMQTLDFGRSDPENLGLTVFKERLGGAPSALSYVRYPAPPHRAGRRLGQRLSHSIVCRMPRSFLVVSGRLLYRHMG